MLQNKQKNADVLLCMTSGNRYVKSNGLHRTVQRTEKRLEAIRTGKDEHRTC